MHIQFGGDLAKRAHPLILNAFALGFAVLVWALAAYIIDLIVQSA
jgi:hypothetical protein